MPVARVGSRRGGLMALRFRNVDASPEDDVRTWPYEALVTAIDRGLVPDWRPIFDEIRRSPWGPVARRVERYLAYRESDGTSTLFALALERARDDRSSEERAEAAAPDSGCGCRVGADRCRVRRARRDERIATQHLRERQGDTICRHAGAHRAGRRSRRSPHVTPPHTVRTLRPGLQPASSSKRVRSARSAATEPATKPSRS